MNKHFKYYPFTVLLVFMIVCIFGSSCVNKKPIDYVNPFIGTNDHGHTFPGAALPGGMVQLGPDTDIHGWDLPSGYHYRDSSIMGFSHLHRSGMGVGDWGDILIMPTTGKLKVEPGSKLNPGEGYRSRFTHKEEKASPGYYAVNLKDYGIKAELTVTERAGYHKYTFPKSEVSHILIDLEHGIADRCTGSQVEIVNNTQIEGYRTSTGFVKNQIVYFCAQFSKPFNSYGTWEGKNIKSGLRKQSGYQIGAFVDYVTSEDETIEVKVGISYTSIDQARLNLKKEIPNWQFDHIKEEARMIWNKELSKIKVLIDTDINETCKNEKLITFYTALYHSLLFPAAFGDVDGKYMGLDDQVHSAKDFTYHSDFSLWDTFRAEMPLLVLIQPEKIKDVINTMIAQYEQGGWLPIPQQFGNRYTNDMIGDHPVSVILDAYIKGIKDFDIEKAFEAVKKNAMETPPSEHRSRGRVGLDYYKEYGYIPSDKVKESVSRTLEYAYDDWCIAQLAKILGKMDDYEMFIKRASYYKNIIDTSTGFARPKNSTGSWIEPFDPTLTVPGREKGNYTEANAWQYTWFVPHDVHELVNLEGGREIFIKKLDTFFTTSSEILGKAVDVTGFIGQYEHGNEPSHHIIYLYDYAGAPWKTQDLVRKVIDNFYNASPAGLFGNDDMGQMSAWLVFSMMGYFPVCPGTPYYVIGSPMFDAVSIQLKKNKEFTIKTINNSENNKYIQSAKLNGKPFDRSYIWYNEIINGGELVFVMGSQPNKTWATSSKGIPPEVR
jgi:predicted alpha-1,2-mannosidase